MTGPSRFFYEKKARLEEIPLPTVEQYKRAALTIARSSLSVDECVVLFDIIGINIKEVWNQ